MRVFYDAQVDALYVEFRPLPPGKAEAREISEDVIANYGPNGKLAGLEILNASSVLGDDADKVVLEIFPSLRAKREAV